MKKLILIASTLVLLSACSDDENVDYNLPKKGRDQYRENQGKLTGESGLVLLGRSEDKDGSASPIGVNSYLWRATLDTLSFMPMASADPFGGVILTDWYEDPKTPGERFKINALILDKTLRADGVKITLFKQKKAQGVWKDEKVDVSVARALEDTILTRARELRVGGK